MEPVNKRQRVPTRSTNGVEESDLERQSRISSLACRALTIVLDRWMLGDLGWEATTLSERGMKLKANLLQARDSSNSLPGTSFSTTRMEVAVDEEAEPDDEDDVEGEEEGLMAMGAIGAVIGVPINGVNIANNESNFRSHSERLQELFHPTVSDIISSFSATGDSHASTVTTAGGGNTPNGINNSGLIGKDEGSIASWYEKLQIEEQTCLLNQCAFDNGTYYEAVDRIAFPDRRISEVVKASKQWVDEHWSHASYFLQYIAIIQCLSLRETYEQIVLDIVESFHRIRDTQHKHYSTLLLNRSSKSTLGNHPMSSRGDSLIVYQMYAWIQLEDKLIKPFQDALYSFSLVPQLLEKERIGITSLPPPGKILYRSAVNGETSHSRENSNSDAILPVEERMNLVESICEPVLQRLEDKVIFSSRTYHHLSLALLEFAHGMRRVLPVRRNRSSVSAPITSYMTTTEGIALLKLSRSNIQQAQIKCCKVQNTIHDWMDADQGIMLSFFKAMTTKEDHIRHCYLHAVMLHNYYVLREPHNHGPSVTASGTHSNDSDRKLIALNNSNESITNKIGMIYSSLIACFNLKAFILQEIYKLTTLPRMMNTMTVNGVLDTNLSPNSGLSLTSDEFRQLLAYQDDPDRLMKLIPRLDRVIQWSMKALAIEEYRLRYPNDIQPLHQPVSKLSTFSLTDACAISTHRIRGEILDLLIEVCQHELAEIRYALEPLSNRLDSFLHKETDLGSKYGKDSIDFVQRFILRDTGSDGYAKKSLLDAIDLKYQYIDTLVSAIHSDENLNETITTSETLLSKGLTDHERLELLSEQRVLQSILFAILDKDRLLAPGFTQLFQSKTSIQQREEEAEKKSRSYLLKALKWSVTSSMLLSTDSDEESQTLNDARTNEMAEWSVLGFDVMTVLSRFDRDLLSELCRWYINELLLKTSQLCVEVLDGMPITIHTTTSDGDEEVLLNIINRFVTLSDNTTMLNRVKKYELTLTLYEKMFGMMSYHPIWIQQKKPITLINPRHPLNVLQSYMSQLYNPSGRGRSRSRGLSLGGSTPGSSSGGVNSGSVGSFGNNTAALGYVSHYIKLDHFLLPNPVQPVLWSLTKTMSTEDVAGESGKSIVSLLSMIDWVRKTMLSTTTMHRLSVITNLLGGLNDIDQIVIDLICSCCETIQTLSAIAIVSSQDEMLRSVVFHVFELYFDRMYRLYDWIESHRQHDGERMNIFHIAEGNCEELKKRIVKLTSTLIS